GVLERASAGRHRYHFGAEQSHAVHIERLAPDVFFAHVHHALEPEPRTHRRGRNSVLACTRLGDDAPFSHSTRKEHLSDSVVDLVSAGVIEILALEKDCGSEGFRKSRGRAQRRWPADIRGQHFVDFARDRGVGNGGLKGRSQLVEGRNQCLGNVSATKSAEPSLICGSCHSNGSKWGRGAPPYIYRR